MKTPILASIALLAGALNASAVVISMSASSGGQLQSGSYVLATTGTTAATNNYPGAEPPANLVDGTWVNNKYLNFGKTDTGVALVAGTNASVPVSQLTFYTANDAAERDPTSYQLYGSNSAIAGGTAVSSLTLISSGSISLPSGRNQNVGNAFSSTVTFTNTTAYTNYLIIFPTVSNPTSANSMQIGEVVFEGSAVPELSSSLLLVAGALPVLRRRRR